MKNKFLSIVAFTLLYVNCISQNNFESGYFINNGGVKTTCFIHNLNWIGNPIKIEYKLGVDSEIKTATINEIKEFYVSDIKFSRFLVKIDNLSENVFDKNMLSIDKAPVFTVETLFLRSIIEGSANLYEYRNGSLVRFFYSVDNSVIEQLVYKHYLTDDRRVAVNNTYMQQLLVNLPCKDTAQSLIKNIRYRSSDLVKYFTRYNECKDSDFLVYKSGNIQQIGVQLNVKPGINLSTLLIEKTDDNYGDVKFLNNLGYQLGMEIEIILPSNKRNIALFFEPTYQFSSIEKDFIFYHFEGYPTITAHINGNYSLLELPVGLKYYFKLKENYKLFISGAYTRAIESNSKIDYTINYETPIKYEIGLKTNQYLIFGLGYNHKNKYSFEIRYGLKHNVVDRTRYWDSKYSSISCIFSYSLLKNQP